MRHPSIKAKLLITLLILAITIGIQKAKGGVRDSEASAGMQAVGANAPWARQREAKR